MEHLNNTMNKNNYFTTQMSPTNAIFVQRLAMEFCNNNKNNTIITKHQKQLGRQLGLSEHGQIVVANVSYPTSTASLAHTTSTTLLPINTTSTTLVPTNTTSTTLSTNTTLTSSPTNTTSTTLLPTNTTSTTLLPINTTSATLPTNTTSTPSPTNTTSTKSPTNTTASLGSISTPVSTSPSITPATTASPTIAIKRIKLFTDTEGYLLPANICQSGLGGRSGSNACTIIATSMAESFLRKKFYTTAFDVHCMILFVGFMLKGNSLYDNVAETAGQLYDAEEAIQTTGMNDFLEVIRVEGVVDTKTFTQFLESLFQENGAHIMIIPPDKTVLIVVHRNECISLFDSHSHGNDGALMFASKCPKAFASYLGVFSKRSYCKSGVIGANIFSLGLKK